MDPRVAAGGGGRGRVFVVVAVWQPHTATKKLYFIALHRSESYFTPDEQTHTHSPAFLFSSFL